MATSTLRFGIVVALVVGGVFVLTKIFPDASAPAPEAAGSPAATATPPADEGERKDKKDKKAEEEGAVIAVFNGTDVDGLAGATEEDLQKAGYEPGQAPGDAPEVVARTALYFRGAEDQTTAEALRDRFFKGAAVGPLADAPATDIVKKVQVAIFLGEDYAAEQ